MNRGKKGDQVAEDQTNQAEEAAEPTEADQTADKVQEYIDKVKAENPPDAPAPSNRDRWLKEEQVAVVQGPSLSQIVWRGAGRAKAAAYVLKYGEGKGLSFRAAFLNPTKKSHVVLGPSLPVDDAGVPDAAGVADEEWAAVDLSAFSAPSLSMAAPRPARAVREPRPPREPRAAREPRVPREPSLAGVGSLSMIRENAELYPFLRLGENRLYFVTNPNRKRSIRWDFAPTEDFLAEYKAKAGIDIPLALIDAALEAAPALTDEKGNPLPATAVVKTRFSRYDITKSADGTYHVEKYKAEDAAPPPRRPERVAVSAADQQAAEGVPQAETKVVDPTQAEASTAAAEEPAAEAEEAKG